MSCVHVLLLAGLIELSVNPDALWVTDSGSRLLYSVFFMRDVSGNTAPMPTIAVLCSRMLYRFDQIRPQ